jgi:UDP-3-O-[3-hydroxymyristoyl] glucosamine N-acyltransferase
MSNNLLIVGASTYAVVAYEIARDMGCFEKIGFIDDQKKATPNGIDVIGTTRDIHALASEYDSIIVAIGNPNIRLCMLEKIKEETSYRIVSLLSPKAYVSPSARIMSGCIVEPMAVVHTGCVLSTGCIISAGAVVNHASTCSEGVHVDCNATVEGYCLVPSRTKICSGEIFKHPNEQNN